MKRAYKTWRAGRAQLSIIAQATDICADYARQGYDLTLRQLYYQFVARGLLPNNNRSYQNLGTTISNARLAGLLDWKYIVDRTRNLEALPHWESPASIVAACAEQYTVDKWTTQPRRIECWVEKEALAGVIGQASKKWDVAYFACRGYVSQSEIWAASQRLLAYINAGQAVTILHLGDHDPSGIDMTRDINDRLSLFIGLDYYRKHNQHLTFDMFEVRRIALNWDQIQQYNPPPNPAKMTDARAQRYVAEYGSESWELDALDPATLDDLITVDIQAAINAPAFEKRAEDQAWGRQRLLTIAGQMEDEDEIEGEDGNV